jgi:hypothetical protein
MCVSSAIHVLVKAYLPHPYHFQADLILCDGTFKITFLYFEPSSVYLALTPANAHKPRQNHYIYIIR